MRGKQGKQGKRRKQRKPISPASPASRFFPVYTVSPILLIINYFKNTIFTNKLYYIMLQGSAYNYNFVNNYNPQYLAVMPINCIFNTALSIYLLKNLKEASLKIKGASLKILRSVLEKLKNVVGIKLVTIYCV